MSERKRERVFGDRQRERKTDIIIEVDKHKEIHTHR